MMRVNPIVECLESRRLSSIVPLGAGAGGAFSGVVFDDHNGSGTQDAGDAGLANVKVFIDVHHTGAFASADPFTITNAQGAYTFSNLKPGTYDFTTVPPAGFQQDFPFGGQEHVATVVAGSALSGFNFAETSASHVGGYIYSNASGKPVGLDAVTVTITAANGKGPVFVRSTDSVGYYGIGGLPNTSYKVTVSLPSGYILASGSATQTTPVLKSGQNDNSVNFTLTPAVVYGSTKRFVSVSVGNTQTATGTSPFNGVAQGQNDMTNVTYNDSGPYYVDLSGTAEQHSTLTPTEISDTGPVNSKDNAVAALEEDNLPVGGVYSVQAESYFQTTFTVKAAEAYSLNMNFNGLGPYSVSFSFIGPGGAQIAPTQSGNSASPVQQGGTLKPGTYTITYDLVSSDNDDNGPTLSNYVLDLKLGA